MALPYRLCWAPAEKIWATPCNDSSACVLAKMCTVFWQTVVKEVLKMPVKLNVNHSGGTLEKVDTCVQLQYRVRWNELKLIIVKRNLLFPYSYFWCLIWCLYQIQCSKEMTTRILCFHNSWRRIEIGKEDGEEKGKGNKVSARLYFEINPMSAYDMMTTMSWF